QSPEKMRRVVQPGRDPLPGHIHLRAGVDDVSREREPSSAPPPVRSKWIGKWSGSRAHQGKSTAVPMTARTDIMPSEPLATCSVKPVFAAIDGVKHVVGKPLRRSVEDDVAARHADDAIGEA